jgi:glycosyltransferase involved in cell wall biosynthesis
MNLGMILNAPYPSDVRVKKETDALIRAGFTIYLLCLGRKGEKSREEFENIHITRIHAGTGNYSLAFWDIIMSLTFKHPVFFQKLKNWVKENKIDALHVHDLPLAGTALAIRKNLNIPVVLDFHENYPDALKVWFEWNKNPVSTLKNKLFMSYQVWQKHEKTAALQADHIIAVVHEMKERLVHNYNIPQEKVTVITNSEEKKFLNQPDDPAIYSNLPNKFIITYTGNIGPHRGVDTIIEALSHLKSYSDINFIIVGSGSNSIMSHLKKRVLELGLSNSVHFLGRQPFSKFYAYMKYADVNVIPHKSNSHTDNTIPHKLFQGMMAGKPMLVSSSTPLKRIINQTKAGLAFEAGNTMDAAEKILYLYQNKAECLKLGTNGYDATVRGNLNWDHDQFYLIELYSTLLSVKK